MLQYYMKVESDNMRKKIIGLVLIFFIMIVFSPIVRAENDYSIKIDFNTKVDNKILWIVVNGTMWNEWESGTNNTFYSDDDKYEFSITYNGSDGFVPYVLYDESWNDYITTSNFCFKGCTYSVTIDNRDQKQNLELSFTTGYNLSFETNGGSELKSKFTEINTKPIKPENPIKKGFVFDGWYADEQLKEPFDFNILLTKDTTIYASWKEKVYSYEFIEGNNQKLTINDIKSFTLKIDGDYSLFQSLKVENLDLIKDEDYTITEGSTVITFTDNGIVKLNTLSKGEYEILIKYANSKEVKGKVILNSEIENPQTRDNYITYIITGIISLIGVISISFYTRRKLVK